MYSLQSALMTETSERYLGLHSSEGHPTSEALKSYSTILGNTLDDPQLEGHPTF
jgi:hypothetical protein